MPCIAAAAAAAAAAARATVLQRCSAPCRVAPASRAHGLLGHNPIRRSALLRVARDDCSPVRTTVARRSRNRLVIN